MMEIRMITTKPYILRTFSTRDFVRLWENTFNFLDLELFKMHKETWKIADHTIRIGRPRPWLFRQFRNDFIPSIEQGKGAFCKHWKLVLPHLDKGEKNNKKNKKTYQDIFSDVYTKVKKTNSNADIYDPFVRKRLFNTEGRNHRIF